MSVRKLTEGVEVSIYGERGRFRYTGQSISGKGKLIYHFIGGADGHEQMRSFYPDKIRRVHRIPKTRKGTR